MISEAWLEALQQRHRSALTTAEFLKAVRALSARYVERRSTLGERSPVDSPGKRAAFAAFYTPLHLITVRAIVRALGAPSPRRIVDLGCGTGAASAAWALEAAAPPHLLGIDRDPWALEEARWNWRQLGLRGETRRGDVLRTCERMLQQRSLIAGTGVVAAWSLNELADEARARLLPLLLELARRGAALLIVEPLAGAATRWWPEWDTAWRAEGGRSDSWRFDPELPPSLRALDESAGFRRDALTAKSLWIGRLTRPDSE